MFLLVKSSLAFRVGLASTCLSQRADTRLVALISLCEGVSVTGVRGDTSISGLGLGCDKSVQTTHQPGVLSSCLGLVTMTASAIAQA